MGRVNEVLDRAITVIVLGIFLAPIALYLFLVVSAFTFFVLGWSWPCHWPLHQVFGGFNPDCPFAESAD